MTLSIMTLSIMTKHYSKKCSAEYHILAQYVESNNAAWCYAYCHSAECRGAKKDLDLKEEL
jgi:hypothetical protein